MDSSERLPPEPAERTAIPRVATTGTLFGVGMGPGEPDYLTIRAMRVLERAPVLVHFCKKGRRGNARTIADAVLAPEPAREHPLVYPYTTELHPDHPDYVAALAAFFQKQVLWVGVATLALLVMVPWVKKLMGGIR